MNYYLYRVLITSMPEGSTWEEEVDGELIGGLDEDWEPEGWNPDEEWIETHGHAKFFWPTTRREYKSRSAAKARAALIESYGATCIVQRSSVITWPEDDDTTVAESRPVDDVAHSVSVLVKAGVLRFAIGGEA